MNKRLRKILGYSFAVFISFCCVCLVLSLAVYSSDSTLFTPTPVLRLPEINLSTVIAQTYSAAQIQTQALLTPTPLFTPTFTPTVTMLPVPTLAESIDIVPTATIFIFELQTNVAQPTEYIYSTITPFSLATQSIQSTQQPSNGNCNPSYPDVCINGNPRLNCAELRKKGIFHFRVPGDDPLGYDKDDDGIGCE